MDHKNVAIALMWYFGHLSDRENPSGEGPYKLKVKKILDNNKCMRMHMHFCVILNKNDKIRG